MVTSDGLTKIGRKFKGSLPSILNEIADAGLEFNKLFPRKFIREYRCIALAFDGSRLVGFGKNKKRLTHLQKFIMMLYICRYMLKLIW